MLAKWRTQWSRTCSSEPGSACACAPLRRTGFGVVLPGAGTIIAIAFLPKCPLCWMVLMTAMFAGFHHSVLALVAVSLVAVIAWSLRTSGRIRIEKAAPGD